MSKKSQKYIFKMRNHFLKWSVGLFLASVIYMWILNMIPGFEEATKYMLAFMPLLVFSATSVLAFDEFWPWQKGIMGEDQIAQILKKHGIEFGRNIQSGDGKFDYDFIFKLNGAVHYLEVKNYKEVKPSKLSEQLFWLDNNAKKLDKEKFISTHNIKPFLIYVSGLPEDMSDERVMAIPDFSNYIKNAHQHSHDNKLTN